MNPSDNSFTKEDHIKIIVDRIEARNRRIEEMVDAVSRMQNANHRDLVRAEELRILRDVRDGKLALVDTATGNRMSVKVFHMGDGNN